MKAREFAQGIRGQFIISQALCLAIEKLKEVDGAMREVSNISDMEYLRDNLFPLYHAVQQIDPEAHVSEVVQFEEDR
jgi:hypothetical protein